MRTESLCRSYGAGDILSDISIEIERGEFAAVMGQSGGGKSTLLYCISGMDKPTSGRVWFDSEDMTGMTPVQMQELRLGRMGFIFQKTSFLKDLSVIDNIVYPAFQLKKKSRSEILAEARGLMREMGISAVEDSDISEVSGGQLQRAAICRAMINHPDILFGDEPTGALNSSATRDVLAIMDKINRGGTTILLVTHDANVALHADRVIYLEDGRVKDALLLGKYEAADNESREHKMKRWLKDMGF